MSSNGYEGERRELVELIRSSGIVRAGDGQDVIDRFGRRAAWGLYVPNVALTSRGMLLAGKAVLEQLSTFRSTQLACFGYTSMPLVAACLLLGDGRYTGLSIRHKPKAYLTRRRIDGPVDRSRSVVVVDDSISSGGSLHRSIAALEAEGLEVEGAVALVTFPHREGVEWACRSGYRVEAVFDIWRDLGMADPRSDPGSDRDRAWRAVQARTEGPRIEAGLAPPTVARRVAELLLTDGVLPRPPDRFDTEYDGRGGVWVSFRDRSTDHRAARDGFWHFDASRSRPTDDLVAATVKTIEASAGAVSKARLQDLKIGVTFFGPLERIAPSELDFDRYGIVVREATFGRKIGGALPNTQVFVSEMEQYEHARQRNAGLLRTEPHELYRHVVTKLVEPGETWLPYGSPDGEEVGWTRDPAVGEALVGRVRTALNGLDEPGVTTQPLPDELIPYPVWGVAVGLYDNGPIGSGVALAAPADGISLDSLVGDAARRAMKPRDKQAGEADSRRLPESVAIVITLLHDRELLGRSKRVAAGKLRRGLDALVAQDGDRRGVALPGAIVYNDMRKRDLVQMLADPGDRAGRRVQWATYRTTAWLGHGDQVQSLRFGYPVRQRADDFSGTVELLANHIVASLGPDGLPAYRIEPATGATIRRGTSARLVSALVALDRAGRILGRDDWVASARPGLDYCLDHLGKGAVPGRLTLPDQRNGILADCVLLGGVVGVDSMVAAHPGFGDLVGRVVGLLRDDGRVCLKPVRLGVQQDHDFLPGAALLASSAAALAGRAKLSEATLAACLTWHRGRFRILHTWGSAGWQPQGWSAVWHLTGDDEQAAFVFEVADWALDRQVAKSGAFLEDVGYHEPSFNTAFIAEAIAAAWGVAVARGDTARAARYGQSWKMAMRFIRTLVVLPEDTFFMADPERAVGGVRMSITRSGLRIDAVSHTLQALVAGLTVLTRSSG